MDAQQFDCLTRALVAPRPRRALLALLPSLPLLAGLLGGEDAEAKGRRRRRKQRHKKRSGNRKQQRKGKRKGKGTGKDKRKQGCTPESLAQTCAGQCGRVPNNCQLPVDCGPCACDPPCPVCQTCDPERGECVADAAVMGTPCAACRRCDDAGQCVECDPCCEEACCTEVGSICHLSTGACCVPESQEQTCAGTCGRVTNTCGQEVDCGDCTCDPACPVCQTCDPDTGECVASGNGEACDDGDRCTSGSTCSNGTCGGGSPVACDSPNECQTGPGTCVPATGECGYPPKDGGTRCGDKCTQACTAGACGSSTPVTCSATECQTAGSCDPATGVCSDPTSLPNGTPCSTGRCCDGVCPPTPTCLTAVTCCENEAVCREQCCTQRLFANFFICPSTFACARNPPGGPCGSDGDCTDGPCVCGTCCGAPGAPCAIDGECCSGVCNGVCV